MGKMTLHDHEHTHSMRRRHAYGYTVTVRHKHGHAHTSQNPVTLLTGEEYGVAPHHREHAHTNAQYADVDRQRR